MSLWAWPVLWKMGGKERKQKVCRFRPRGGLNPMCPEKTYEVLVKDPSPERGR